MIHSSPLWDADGNLMFRIFELGKADTPIRIVYDDDFEKMLRDMQGNLETARAIDKIKKYGEVEPSYIYMPALTPSTNYKDPYQKEGMLISRILVKVGQEIQKDTDIMEIEQDKANVIIPAGKAGRIMSILVKPGAVVEENDPLLAIDTIDDGKAIPKYSDCYCQNQLGCRQTECVCQCHLIDNSDTFRVSVP